MKETATAALVVASMLGCSGTAVAAGPQDISIPLNIEKLSEKALESVNVTVDGPLLQLTSQFLSSTDPEQKQVKELIGGLKGVYVRSFEFADAGQYSDSDVEAIRVQLKAPEWSKMVTVRSKAGGDNVDVFFKTDQGKIAGLVIIAAEAKELTLVNIVGSIDLEQLSKLGGQFGIPKLDVESKQK